jgi:CBS domain-containing protein/gamma-glutamyl:cysteine ligase YbdK (ATP-grasp superfamily)
MGEHSVSRVHDEQHFQTFTKALLADIQALEYMLAEGMLESGVRRIGAEQELFLVDHSMLPACVAMEVLEQAAEPRLTTEIAKFNLEANLTARLFGGPCLREMEAELKELLGIASKAASSTGAAVLLTGILPTLRRSDLSLNNLTPTPRYCEMNESLTRQKGGSFQIHVKGLDELQMSHDNVLLEGCNTSFQVHLQVGPEEFPKLYNIAQAITAPVLAAATNSPLLFGYRLWQETRIALFQHAVDGRTGAQQVRAQPTRVSFGERWVKDSVLEIFRDDLTRYRVILESDPDEDPMEVLARGEIPQLRALRLYNGSVWRWNRPCYGISEGRPHLRIENRSLPSGPTVIDEMANAALSLGLMVSLGEEYGDITHKMDFEAAKNNFYAAARYGLQAQFSWIGGRTFTAAELILNHLLELARQGLKSAGVDSADADRYLGVIDERVRSGQTGSQWALRSIAAMGDEGTETMRLNALSKAMLEGLHSGSPVHTWPKAELKESDDWRDNYQTVGQFMTTDLFTLRAHDIIDLAARVMAWRHVRHIPVEDDEGGLVGLVTCRDLIRYMARGGLGKNLDAVPVREIMKTNPLSVSPDTPTLEAIALMRRHKVGCMPVVDGRKLVGIVTATDFLNPAARLFEEYLKD